MNSLGPTHEYRFERDLVRSTARAARQVLSPSVPANQNEWCFVGFEIQAGAVIPDVLICVSAGAPLWPRKPISVIEANVLAHIIRSGGASIDDLAEGLFLSPSGATRAATAITNKGLAHMDIHGVLRSTFTFSDVRLVALEFKLRRWRAALEQASAYFEFANESYIVVDGAQVKDRQRLCSECAARGVGVMFADGQRLEVLLQSEHKLPTSAMRIQLLQKLSMGINASVGHPILKSSQPDTLMYNI